MRGGTAFPICSQRFDFDPLNSKPSGNPWSMAASCSVTTTLSGWFWRGTSPFLRHTGFASTSGQNDPTTVGAGRSCAQDGSASMSSTVRSPSRAPASVRWRPVG